MNRELYVVGADGTDLTRLWSPDGEAIAYVIGTDGRPLVAYLDRAQGRVLPVISR